jgi:pSer/pThr/pTyr-binding forkhead associated (FHA) protein
VNDERVLGERQLHHGDRIRFHKFEFEFSTEGSDASPSASFAGDQTLISDRNALLAAGLAPGMRTGSAPAPTRERG